MTRLIPPLLLLAEGRRPRPRAAPKIVEKESRLHIAVVHLLRLQADPEWQFWHSANGEKRDVRAAAKLKAMGVKRGVPDLVLASPRGGGLHCIEFKTGGGRLTLEQEEFQTWAIRHGVPFSVVRSVDEAVTVLKAWGVLCSPDLLPSNVTAARALKSGSGN